MPSDPRALVESASTRVRDPVSGRSVWLSGMVQNVRRKGEQDIAFDLHFGPQHSPADRRAIPEAIEANLRGLGFEGKAFALAAGAPPGHAHGPTTSAPAPASRPAAGPPRKDPVPGMSGPGMQMHGGPPQKQRLEGVRHVVAVASGKGGVGKSTVSVNLAVALARLGHRVGLVDCDIYGPSVPMMMNIDQRPAVDQATRKIVPVMAHGVRCLSMGMLLERDEAVIWRGPMVMSAVKQFLQDASWSGLDYLIVDLPPGTGDAQLTLVQAVELSGAVIVTTPQPVALGDAIRGISMFRKLDVPLLGLVENMAYYELPDGTRDHVFGEDGGARTAAEFETELLGQIPLRRAIRQGGDDGDPTALGEGGSAEAFLELARRVAEKLDPVAP